MATDPAFLAHVRDLFADLFEDPGAVTTGRMFSGTALFVEGDVMFAAILADTVWMKSGATTHESFIDAGSRPFSHDRKSGIRTVRSLMRRPEAALDDPDTALSWARLSLPPARVAAEQKRRDKAQKAARP